MLDVELLLLVAGPSDFEAVECAIGNVALDFVLIEEVGRAVGISEKQPIPPCCRRRPAVLEKRTERRDAGAWADHDDVGAAIRRKPEGVIAVDINARLFLCLKPVREKR